MRSVGPTQASGGAKGQHTRHFIPGRFELADAGRVVNQNISFKANCHSLGSDASLVTVPNAELEGVVFGAAKTG